MLRKDYFELEPPPHFGQAVYADDEGLFLSVFESDLSIVCVCALRDFVLEGISVF